MDSPYIHEKALCESVNIGARTRVWAFAHILPGAIIGEDCNVCDGVFIENDVVVGDRAATFCEGDLQDPGVLARGGDRSRREQCHGRAEQRPEGEASDSCGQAHGGAAFAPPSFPDAALRAPTSGCSASGLRSRAAANGSDRSGGARPGGRHGLESCARVGPKASSAGSIVRQCAAAAVDPARVARHRATSQCLP